MSNAPDSPAFHIISTVKEVPIFIFGDHASRHIPTQYDNLGLNGDDLTRHIAWDIGTETVIRELCAYFGCGGQLAGVSRLVIDLNRDPAAAGLIPAESDGTLIPANAVSEAERQDRMAQFYTPYHAALGQNLDRLTTPFVLSIHSFTPQPKTGAARPTDIGLLMRHDEASAKAFQKLYRAVNPNFNVDINLPYSAYDLNYTVDEHIAPRGLRHLAIEIRQDHIDTDAKARAIAKTLTGVIEQIINAKD